MFFLTWHGVLEILVKPVSKSPDYYCLSLVWKRARGFLTTTELTFWTSEEFGEESKYNERDTAVTKTRSAILTLRSDGGLTFETSAFKLFATSCSSLHSLWRRADNRNVSFEFNSLRWPVYIINSVDISNGLVIPALRRSYSFTVPFMTPFLTRIKEFMRYQPWLINVRKFTIPVQDCYATLRTLLIS